MHARPEGSERIAISAETIAGWYKKADNLAIGYRELRMPVSRTIFDARRFQ
jgi:hypothetical protein